MVMGHSAAPASISKAASVGSGLAISVPVSDSVSSKAVLKIRV